MKPVAQIAQPAIVVATNGRLLAGCPGADLTAKPAHIRVTSLGTGTQALSGTISAKTPSAPNWAISSVTATALAPGSPPKLEDCQGR